MLMFFAAIATSIALTLSKPFILTASPGFEAVLNLKGKKRKE